MEGVLSQRDYLRSLLQQMQPDLSLRTLSARAGLKSPATLSMILSGKRPLTVHVALGLARALSLSRSKRELLLLYAQKDTTTDSYEGVRLQEKILEFHQRAQEKTAKVKVSPAKELRSWSISVPEPMLPRVQATLQKIQDEFSKFSQAAAEETTCRVRIQLFRADRGQS